MTTMTTVATPLTAGLGLKPQHYDDALACTAPGLWFEVHPENYLAAGGPRRRWLEAVREHHPLSLHGVSLSLAADVRPDPLHLQRLAELVACYEPTLVSEHLAWSWWNGAYHPDLLPFPRSSEALRRIADNIALTQETLRRPIAIENPSHYLAIDGHDWSEPEFLAELTRRSGCALLLDINNVHVSACNMGYDATAYLDDLLSRVAPQAIAEIHLAGHTPDPTHGEHLLIDSHDAPVAPVVWALYQQVIARLGARPTLIERDDKLPAFTELLAERARAVDILAAHPAAALACAA
jgi:hypothetical protein